MARRNDHSREEIRQLALRATVDIIGKHGLQSLSARKIASAIGYAPGSLYLVFENLDDLILQVNALTLQDLYDFVSTAPERGSDGAARILAFARAYLQFALDNRHRWNAIFEHRPSGYDTSAHHRKHSSRLFTLIEEALQEILPEPFPHEPAQSARALWGGVHGICILTLSGKLNLLEGDDPQTVIELLVNNYIAGLTAPHPGSGA